MYGNFEIVVNCIYVVVFKGLWREPRNNYSEIYKITW